METKNIKIDSLITANLQIRVSLDENAIADYARDMKNGDEFVPIVVFRDPKRAAEDVGPYLADGFHRVEAARRVGLDTILAEVRDGTFTDALAFALKANSKHGVRRTYEDKRNAMRIAWENRAKLFGGMTPTERHFAAVCGVSNGTAHNFLSNNGLLKMSKTVIEGGRHGVPTLPAGEPKADALKVTREHLEERNPTIRALLKDNKDRFGMDIPQKLVGAFLSREPQQLVRDLNGLYGSLENRRLKGDIVFAPFVAFAMTHLDNLINTIRHGEVYCVCRMCRGEGCGSCNHLGFQTKPQYDRNPPESKAETV